MKRIVKTLKTASRISPDITIALFNSLLLPLLIMAGFGAFYIFREGYGLHFAGLLAASSLLMVAPVLWRKRQEQEQEQEQENFVDESLVQPSGDWGAFDQQIWEQQNDQIPQLLEQNDEWDQLKEHGLTIITHVAKDYGRKELAFSLPELLKMTEEISRRYRKILLEHAPFIEKIPFSLYKYGYQHQEEAKKGIQISSWVFNAYRALRLTTPAGVISEIRSRILGETFGSLSTRLQHQLKQALLQEVISVAIDLYSGRFNIGDDEITASSLTNTNEDDKPFTPEPLRICLIGQVSAGKSSIINALKNELVAETSRLPSTDRVTVYQCSIEGVASLNLTDLPGFDGDEKTDKLLLEQVTKANVILWVLKANQPARSTDQAFKAKLEAFYQQPGNRSKKQPVIIGVLNQTDQLKNEHLIIEAQEYNRALLDFKDIVPLSVPKNKPAVNLPALEQFLDEYFDEGMLVQLNQRRMKAGETINLSEQAKRVYHSGKSLFSLFKSSLK